MASLKQALLLKDSGVISLVGAGGKTSLMFALAREFVEAGMTVITTTTTKIYVPSQKQSAHIIASESVEDVLSRARNLVKKYPHVTAAAGYSTDKRKLIGLSPASVNVLWESKLCQWIIFLHSGRFCPFQPKIRNYRSITHIQICDNAINAKKKRHGKIFYIEDLIAIGP